MKKEPSIKELAIEMIGHFKEKDPDMLVVDMYAAFWVAIEGFIVGLSEDHKDLGRARASLLSSVDNVLERLTEQGWK